MSDKMIENFQRFAADHVATRPELHHAKDFPADLWRAMGTNGLLGLGLPEDCGGGGGNFSLIADCCRTLSEAGGNLGVAMSWMAHNLNAKLHLVALGTDAQKSRWLPGLARGDYSLSIAISEPGAGAHPKRLKCAALRDGDDYVLNGEKAYLTNGPLADVFLVLAITGQKDGRNQFSAFLVPRDSAGFEQTEGVEINFLRPSPHCGIRLTDCRVPAENMLGPEGTAFERISLKMRAVEDALGTAAQAGGLAYLLHRLAADCVTDPGPEMIAELGSLATLSTALNRLCQTLADDLDAGHLDGDYLNPLSAGFREVAVNLQNRIDDFINEHSVTTDETFNLMRRDLIKSRSIAASVHQARARQYGAALLNN